MIKLQPLQSLCKLVRTFARLSTEEVGHSAYISPASSVAAPKHGDSTTLQKSEHPKALLSKLQFSPAGICLGVEIGRKPLGIFDVIPVNQRIECPLPSARHVEINDSNISGISTEIGLPSLNQTSDDNVIQAARLIVIRKRKMKKHKLRKLRQKMKFEWAKVRQRREMRKEKVFQAELILKIKTAEKFSAEEYVSEKLRLATETPIPRLWKGKRLPQFIIKQKLGIK